MSSRDPPLRSWPPAPAAYSHRSAFSATRLPAARRAARDRGPLRRRERARRPGTPEGRHRWCHGLPLLLLCRVRVCVRLRGCARLLARPGRACARGRARRVPAAAERANRCLLRHSSARRRKRVGAAWSRKGAPMPVSTAPSPAQPKPSSEVTQMSLDEKGTLAPGAQSHPSRRTSRRPLHTRPSLHPRGRQGGRGGARAVGQAGPN